MNKSQLLMGTALSTLLVASQTPVSAQSESPKLETMIVTAQKRSEDLQRVPISVTSLSSSELERGGVKTTQDLSISLPSLNYNNFAGFGEPFLRGIGTDLTQPNVDASVATYIDGVFVSGIYGQIVNLLGVDRVEVLAGPQGTLYGRNAIGGAINIYTLSPSQEFKAKGSAVVGNYARKEFSGYVSGPITDKLSAGLYVGGIKRHSYYSSVMPTNPPSHQPEKETSWGIRGKFTYEPTSTFTVKGSLEATRMISRENALRQISPNAVGYLFGAPVINEKYIIANNYADYLNTRTRAVSLSEEWDMCWARLVAITGYRELNTEGATDFDGTTADVFGFASHSVTNQFSQELQLVSPDDSPFKWIGGLYYYTEWGGFVPVTQNSRPFFGPLGFGSINAISKYRTRSYAAFAQSTVPLSFIDDNLSLTAGVRYSVETKAWHASQTVNVLNADQTVGPQIGPTMIFPSRNKRWSNFSPKLTLDYTIDDTMFYASFSKGFKSGVYNLVSTDDPGPANPEKLTSYEIGSKSSFWDRRIYLNTSAYYYDFKDIQVQIIPAGATIVQNAASATAKGFEISLEAAVTDELNIKSGLAYETGVYNKFPNYAATSGPFDATGRAMQRVAKWVYSASASYEHTLANNAGEIHADASWYWNGGFNWEPTGTAHQSPYSLVNTSLGYTLPNGGPDLTIWCTNLFNKYYLTGISINSLGVLTADAPPRMFGVRLTQEF